jgi:pilus assembly protein Flp/PilA
MTRTYVHLLGLVAFISGRFEDRKDRGATAVEYGLLVGVIAIGLITAFTAFKGDLTTFFSNVANDLDGP